MSNSTLKKGFNCPFTQVPNEIINDERVSLKAKGLYLYMVSKPDNWEFSMSGIASQNKDGREAVSNIIKELIKFGYLIEHKNRINGKFAISDYEILLNTIKPVHVGKTDTVKPSRENRPVKTCTSNKEIVIKNKEEEEHKTIFFEKDLHEKNKLVSTTKPHLEILPSSKNDSSKLSLDIDLTRLGDFLISEANLNRAKNKRAYMRRIKTALLDVSDSKHQETRENYEDYISITLPDHVNVFDMYEHDKDKD